MSLLMEALKKAEEAKEQASKHSSSDERTILSDNDKKELAKSEKMLDDLSLLHESAKKLKDEQAEHNAGVGQNIPIESLQKENLQKEIKSQAEPQLRLEPLEDTMLEDQLDSENPVTSPKTIKIAEPPLSKLLATPFVENKSIAKNNGLVENNNTIRSESAKLVTEIESKNRFRQIEQQKSTEKQNITSDNPVTGGEYDHDRAKRLFSVSSKRKTRQPIVYLVSGILLFSTVVGVVYYNYLGSQMGLQQTSTQFVSQSVSTELEFVDNEPLSDQVSSVTKLSVVLEKNIPDQVHSDNEEKSQLAKRPVTKPAVAKLTVAKLTVAKPSVTKPSVTKPSVTKPTLSTHKVPPVEKVKKAKTTKSNPRHIANENTKENTKENTRDLTKNGSVSSVNIVRQAIEDPILSQLKRAYNYYQKGNYSQAMKVYQNVLDIELANRDARLGLAAIAMQTDDLAQAHRHYQYLLRMNPKDSIALSGVMSAITGANAIKSESQIKLMLDQEPRAPHLHFTLGNLLAAQSRWSDAQQAYFQAYRFDPDNADYAYNLAVSLDFMGKQKSALTYYRKSLSLSKNRHVSFNGQTVLNRINDLSNYNSKK